MGTGFLGSAGRITAVAAALMGCAAQTQAADYRLSRPVALYAPPAAGLLSDGPNCGVALAHPEWPRVWLGHFQGGVYPRRAEGPNLLSWSDLYVCFPSRVACARFLRQMSVATRGDRFVRRVEGYKTCLPIR